MLSLKKCLTGALLISFFFIFACSSGTTAPPDNSNQFPDTWTFLIGQPDMFPTDDCYPAWSPDGSNLAFFGLGYSGPGIYIYSRDSEETNFFSRGIHPTWSPDGEKIAYRKSTTEESLGLWWMAIDKSDSSFVNMDGTYPNWSPDGENLVVVIREDTFTSNLWISPIDGSLPTQLTFYPEDGAYLMDPEWSPSGDWIVYDRNNTGDDFPAGTRIQLVSADGSQEIPITDPEEDFVTRHPVWSPTDDKLAFVKNGDVWIHDLGNGERVHVTDRMGNNYTGTFLSPSWSPLNDVIACLHSYGSDSAIFLIPVP